MKNVQKRLFSAFLMLSMATGLLPAAAFAEVPESAEESCFSCGLAEHTHTDATGTCYENQLNCLETEEGHIHSEGCYTSVLVCPLQAHTHAFACLTEAAQAQVTQVNTLLAAMPGLQEMKDARNASTYQTTLNTDETNQQNYMNYLSTGFAARTAAQQAYDALPAVLQPFVIGTAALEETWPQATFAAVSKQITAGPEEYVYQYSNWHYEWSLHDNARGSSASTFMLVDTSAYDGKTWVPSGAYDPGTSNYAVAYCCDVETDMQYDSYYRRINLEDATYYSAEDAAQIRAIALSSYPFITADAMRTQLKAGNTGLSDAEIDAISEVEMISAVQNAIWSYSNSSLSAAEHDKLLHYGNSWKMRTNGIYHDLSNEVWYWWRDDSQGIYANHYDDVARRIEAMIAYLRGLNGIAPATESAVITAAEVVGTPILKDGDVYEVMLKVTHSSSGADDNLTITANSSIAQAQASVAAGTTETLLRLNAHANETISINLTGTQCLPTGVYFYEPQATEETAARKVSQNLVGIAMGDTPVHASAAFPLTVEDEDAAAVRIVKKNSAGQVLSGAEFALQCAIDAEGTMETVKTYTTDAQGAFTVENLIVGKTYQLVETKAPEGYLPMEGAICLVGSAVSAEETVVELPTEASWSSDKEGAILVVLNQNKPGGGTIERSISVTAKKRWTGDDSSTRPENITVQLLKNGIPVREATLSAATNWQYIWRGLDRDETWTVAEVVPAGYESAIAQSGTIFTITNTLVPEEPPSETPPEEPPKEVPPKEDPPEDVPPEDTPPEEPDAPPEEPKEPNSPAPNVPKTGDSISPWLVLFGLSAAGLFLTNTAKRRKKNTDAPT